MALHRVITGMNEGLVPEGGSVDPFLTDSVRQRLGLLGRFIDAEKQVILVVCKVGHSGLVFETLKKVIGPDITGKGFAFVQTVNKVLGFSEAK